MAMRQQPRHSDVTRPRPIGRQYQDFQPNSEKKEERDAHVLLIQLPGFTKDRVRITYVHSSRIVRVSGERPIDNTRWSRFNQAFPVPENCEVDKIHAKFEHGALTIKMPKKVLTRQVPPKKEAATSAPSASPSTSSEAKPRKEQEVVPPEATSTTTAPTRPLPVPEAKQEKIQEVVAPAKSTATTSPLPLPPQKPAAEKEQKGTEGSIQKPTLPPNGGQKEAEAKKEGGLLPPKAVMETKPLKSQDETPQKPEQVDRTTEDVRSEGVERVKEAEKAYDHAESSLSRKAEKHVEKAMVKEKETKEETRDSTLSGLASVIEKENGISGGVVDGDKTKKLEDLRYSMGKRIKEMSASVTEAVTRMANKRLNDEDKQLLINMGTAFVVILALGAYVTYRIRSSVREI